MTKAQARDVAQARAALKMGMDDYAARSISMLIRAALRNSDALELIAVAKEMGIDKHPEFIA